MFCFSLSSRIKKLWNLKYFQTALMELWIPRECCRFSPNTFNPVGVSGDLNNESMNNAALS